MVVALVEDSNNRREDFEGAPASTNNIGSGPGPGLDPDFYYQAAGAWGRRINSASSTHGFGFTDGATVDMTVAGDNVWMAKVLLSSSGAIGLGGVRVRIGSITTAFHEYMLKDDGSQGVGEFEYPARGGWLLEPIDPNVVEWRDGTTGTPGLTVVDYFAVTGFVVRTSNNPNLFMDAIDIGPGLWLTAGTGADPNGIFQDFADDDQGTIANRFGHVSTIEGVVFIFGKMVIGQTAAGTGTLTTFIDQNITVIFPGGRVAAGWNGFLFDQPATGTSIFRFTNVVMQCPGRDGKKRYFSNSGDVNGGTDVITFDGNTKYATGDACLYSVEGGSNAVTGLTDATVYYVESLSTTQLHLHLTRAAAFNVLTPIALTAIAAGSSEQHSLTLQPDTRPDFIANLTSNAVVVAGSTTFDGFRTIDVSTTPLSLFSACSFVNCNRLDITTAGTGVIDGCAILEPSTTEGIAFVLTDSLDEILDTSFDLGGISVSGGHAIEINTAGTYNLQGCTFIDYGPTEVSFVTSTIDAGTDQVVVDATFYAENIQAAAVFYEKRGGTDATGLTSGTRYYIRKQGADSVSFHRTKNDAQANTQLIALTTGLGESHWLSSADADIVNTSGGVVNISVSGGGDVPTLRSTGAGETNIQTIVNIEVTGVTEGTRCAIYDAAGTELMNELAYEADGAGAFKASQDFIFALDTKVTLTARCSGKPLIAWLDDGGVFTDITDGLNNTPDIVTVLPAVPVLNDAFYIGHSEIFEKVNYDLVAFAVLASWRWEYWNGAAWTSLTTTDGTGGFTKDGIQSWTAPGGWAATSVNGSPSYFYIRLRVNGSATAGATMRKVTVDNTRFLPYTQENTITINGLSVKATWIEDTVSIFNEFT
tara:strand:- start:47603 stop:50218 length:2616 start_codon:yes stop_codon:yes gene_type:complete